MLKVLEHILMTRPMENPAYPAYSEAIKDLQQDCTHELHRLAMKMPDHLLVSIVTSSSIL
jgi:exportin-5